MFDLNLSSYVMNSLLLVTILFFAMRIVFKRRNSLGLVLPSAIVISSSIHLFTLEPWHSAIFGIVIVILALATRVMYHKDMKQNNNVNEEIIGGVR